MALDEAGQVLRLGTCKRNEVKLVGDLPAFDGHVARFLDVMPRFQGWRVEKVAIAPRLGASSRKAIRKQGYLPEDLLDLAKGL